MIASTHEGARRAQSPFKYIIDRKMLIIDWIRRGVMTFDTCA
jgi:hypothetical protein